MTETWAKVASSLSTCKGGEGMDVSVSSTSVLVASGPVTRWACVLYF